MLKNTNEIYEVENTFFEGFLLKLEDMIKLGSIRKEEAISLAQEFLSENYNEYGEFNPCNSLDVLIDKWTNNIGGLFLQEKKNIVCV